MLVELACPFVATVLSSSNGQRFAPRFAFALALTVVSLEQITAYRNSLEVLGHDLELERQRNIQVTNLPAFALL